MNDDASKAFVPYIDLVGRQNDHSVNTVLNSFKSVGAFFW